MQRLRLGPARRLDVLAKRLEGIVWGAIVDLVQEPEVVLKELQRRGRSADRPDLRI